VRVRVQVSDPFGSMSSTNAQFEMLLRGNLALEDLDRHAAAVIAKLERDGRFVDLKTDLDLGLPELRVVLDREKAAELGVDAATLAQVVQVMIGGLDVGVYKEEGKRYDIRMKLEDADRRSPAAIADLFVRARDGKVVELRNLVELKPGAAASSISRTDRQRSVTITSNLAGISLGADPYGRAFGETGLFVRELVVVGYAAGIGFTVALFVSVVAFPAGSLQDSVKMGALFSFAVAPITMVVARILRVKKRAQDVEGPA